MSWWELVSGKVNPGDKLFTPGRGLQGLRKKAFSILSKGSSKIIIASGSSRIPLDRLCFDTIERAFHKNPYIWLRVAALRDNEPLKDSADKLIREATGSQLARGNYVCSILEHCGLVRYSMRGNQKGIELIDKATNRQSEASDISREKRHKEQVYKTKLLKICERRFQLGEA